jgi:hypothetical protein
MEAGNGLKNRFPDLKPTSQNPRQPADFANLCYKTHKKVRIFYKFAKYFPNKIETTHKKLVTILPLIYPKQNTLLESPSAKM